MSFKQRSYFSFLRLSVLMVMLTGHLPLSAQEIPRSRADCQTLMVSGKS